MTDEPDLDLETPEADAYEQRQRVAEEDDDSAEEVEGDELGEANEADVIEQRIPVRGDGDDYDA